MPDTGKNGVKVKGKRNEDKVRKKKKGKRRMKKKIEEKSIISTIWKVKRERSKSKDKRGKRKSEKGERMKKRKERRIMRNVKSDEEEDKKIKGQKVTNS